MFVRWLCRELQAFSNYLCPWSINPAFQSFNSPFRLSNRFEILAEFLLIGTPQPAVKFFGDPATFSAGALNGLGWDSTWNLSVGANYNLSDCLAVRAGYNYGPSPIDGSPESGLNLATPLILEHMLSFGATMNVSKSLQMHVAYTHGFENELNGPIQNAAGAVAGSTLKQKVSVHFLTVGFTSKF